MKWIDNYLKRAALQRFRATEFMLGACFAMSLIFALVLAWTKSWMIALSLSLCLLIQCIDLLRIKVEGNTLKQEGTWPKFLDAIHSQLWSGSNFETSIIQASKFCPAGTQWAFDELVRDIDSGIGLDLSLVNLKTKLANPVSDRFVELARLANQVGGYGFLPALKAQSAQLRTEHSAWIEIKTKQSWVISSARLGVFAPWLVLLLLASRPETVGAFQTEAGLFVLMFGLFSTLFAFKLVRLLAKLPVRPRVLVG